MNLAALFRFFAALLLATSLRAAVADLPITDDEARTFGASLADKLNAGDVDGFMRSLDMFALGRRASEGLDFNERERSEFISGLVGEVGKSFAVEFAKWKSAHASRVSTVQGEKRVLVRVVSADGACNFLDIVCARRAAGGLKAVDFHSMLTGELVSESTRRAVLPALAQQRKSLLERLTSRDSAYVAALPTIQRAIKDNQAGFHAKALTALEGLPREVQVMPLVMLQRLQAAYKLDEKRYLTVIEDWEKSRPGDASLEFVSIDGHYLRKDYAAAARAIANVQKQTGPDGYLELLRSGALNEGGKFEEARATIRHALEIEPTLSQAYDFWFSLELGRKDWAGLVTAIHAFEKANPNLDIWPGISGEESWAEFRASAECKAWRAEKDGAK